MVKKSSIKALAFILATMLICTLVPHITFAATIAEQYGLSVISDTYRVQIFDDYIGAYTHNKDSSRYLKSTALINALASSKGYTLSYVDANKADVASDSVRGGFVKLTKDGEADVYIPVRDRGDNIGGDSFANATLSNNGGAVVNNQHGGIGGKAADDYAYSFIGGNGFSSVTDVLEKGIIWTIEFNIYADGDAIARGDYANGNLFKWNPDGNFDYYKEEKKEYGSVYLERGKWHRVAITNDVNRGRLHICVDGVHLIDRATTWNSGWDRVILGIDGKNTSGMVAYDNREAYYGFYYYTDFKSFAPNSSANIIFDNANKLVKYDEYAYLTPSDLLAALDAVPGVNYVGAFADNTLTAPATQLDANTILVFEDSNQCYNYYTIQPFGEDYVPTVVDMGIVSNNRYVMVTEDVIAVFSNNHPKHGSYFISSQTLNESLTSTAGYTLTWVNADKEPAQTDSVTDGYIMASLNGGRTLYIPVVKRYDIPAAKPYRSYESDKVSYNLSATAGVGKDASDTCEAWTATSAITRPNRSEWQIFANNQATTVYTIVFNMRADGDAVPAIYYRYSDFPQNGKEPQYLLFRWDANGEFVYNQGDSNNASAFDHVVGGKLDRSKWQQVAITFDYPRGRFHIYVNGKLITETTAFVNFGVAGHIRYGIAGSTSNGTAYFDDIECYYGYFYADEYSVGQTTASSVNLTCDDGVAYYNADKIKTPADLKSAILASTSASAVKIFADDTLTAEATELNSNTVVMVTASNGHTYTWYKPEAARPQIDATIDEDGIINTTLIIPVDIGESCTFYGAAYRDNELVALIPYATDGNAGKYDAFSIPYDSGCSYKAFVWTDADQTPAAYVEFGTGN